MTEAEALEILKKHNIHRGYYDTDRLILNGEQVGIISFGIIYLSDYIPSVIGKSFMTVHSTAVHLSKPYALEILIQQIDQLEASAERYAEDIRLEKLSVMRKYFNDKRISAE